MNSSVDVLKRTSSASAKAEFQGQHGKSLPRSALTLRSPSTRHAARWTTPEEIEAALNSHHFAMPDLANIDIWFE